jgi:pimeloyl-ACP methyl ester carboxylesterase
LPTVEADGTELYYEEYGDGFPMILVHPWPADHAMWFLQTPVFSEYFRVITPDIRGLGKSARPSKGYQLSRLSKDLLAIYENLGINKSYLIGSSLGGAICQKFTIDHPDRVRATIWIGTPSYPVEEMVVEGVGKSNQPTSDVYLEALAKGYLNFWNTIWKPTMHYQFHERFSKSQFGDYLVRYLFEERYARMNGDAYGAIELLKAAYGQESIVEDLIQSTVPSAIIHGEDDDTAPVCKKQHELLPKSEYLSIPQSGHFCYLDQAEIFNKFVLDFVNRH